MSDIQSTMCLAIKKRTIERERERDGEREVGEKEKKNGEREEEKGRGNEKERKDEKWAKRGGEIARVKSKRERERH